MMAGGSRQIGSRGFTLVEMLVALAILGVLMVGLNATLRTAIEVWRRQASTLEQSGRLEAVDRALRRLIQDASGGFEGTANSFAFDGRMPLSVPAHLDQARVVFAIDADKRLVLRWTSRFAQSEGGQQAKGEAVLMEGVASIRFDYWIATENGGRGGWTDQSNQSAPPTLIRIRIVRTGNRTAEWPDILAAPHVHEFAQ